LLIVPILLLKTRPFFLFFVSYNKKRFLLSYYFLISICQWTLFCFKP
jgi:hypothetical protein